MQVGRDELKINAFLAYEGFEGFWALIVQNFEGLAETTHGQIGV